SQAVNSSFHVDEILQQIARQAREQIGAEMSEIHILDGRGGHGVRFSGLKPGDCKIRQRPTLAGLNGEVLRTGQPLRLSDRREHPASVPLPPGHPEFGPFLGAPILVKGECVADILLIRSVGSPPFTQDDEDFLVTMAHTVGIALENAMLHEQVQHLATLQERERIGRELHDGLAQTLGYLNLRTRVAVDRLVDGQYDKALTCLQEIREVVQEAYQEVRRAIFDLRTASAAEGGLIPALQEYLYEYELQSDVKTELTVDESVNNALTLQAEVQLMRIIQEGLSNVRRHAHATQVNISLRRIDNTIRLLIEDNGQGFSPKRTHMTNRPHFGLQIMRERADSIGGHLQIHSSPGAGTRLEVTLPLNGVVWPLDVQPLTGHLQEDSLQQSHQGHQQGNGHSQN
ncbi:MAG TPA: GAF domain-containing sensor histidine kinase, partial [Anaerolineae bacterium]|nr:GAF domain-containing sensor histidine kinase [Anaerolineae bacterium]